MRRQTHAFVHRWLSAVYCSFPRVHKRNTVDADTRPVSIAVRPPLQTTQSPPHIPVKPFSPHSTPSSTCLYHQHVHQHHPKPRTRQPATQRRAFVLVSVRFSSCEGGCRGW